MAKKSDIFEQEDFLKKTTVRVVTKLKGKPPEKNITGSGIIYKREGYDYFYIFTALHCIYGDHFEFQQKDIESIIIQYKYFNEDEFKNISVEPTHVIAAEKDDDFAILLVPGEEILKIIPDLPEVSIPGKWQETDTFKSNGYPKALENGSFILELKYKQREKNGFLVTTDIHISSPTGNSAIYTIGGYSGSGVFKTGTNQLVGIIPELKNHEGWGDILICKKILDIDVFIEDSQGEIKEWIKREKGDQVNGEEEKVWEKAKKTDTLSSYREYLQKYPGGKYSGKAAPIIEEFEAWFDTLAKGTQEAFLDYKRKYTHGRFDQSDFDDRLIYLALKNISKYGDTDIFPYPFETFIFKEKTKEVIKDIKALDKNFSKRLPKIEKFGINFADSFYPQNISTVSPSGHTGFRWVTQIEPIWNAYYLWLVLSIAAEIEKARVGAGKNNFFSYRFKPDYETGALFVKRDAFKLTDTTLLKLEREGLPQEILDKLKEIEKGSIFQSEVEFIHEVENKIGEKAAQYRTEILRYSKISFSDWHAFQDYSYEFINKSSYEWVITCDIAEFYHRIDHLKLGEYLDGLTIDSQTRQKIKELLRIFSKNKPYGLPIGGNASRILAELVLSKIDYYLDQKEKQEEMKFCRFVDDFHIFAKSEPEARSILNKFAAFLLNSHGLSLQKQKTQILSKAEFNKLIKVRLFADTEDETTKSKARFMILETGYPTELVDETAGTPGEEKFDIEELLNDELRKTRLHDQFTKRLLTSLKRQKDEILSRAFVSIFKKGSEKQERLDTLYPIFSTLMIAVYQNFDRLVKVKETDTKEVKETDTKELIYKRLLELLGNKSFILDIELHLAYLIRALGKGDRIIQIHSEDDKYEEVDLLPIMDKCYNGNLHSTLIKSLIMENYVKWEEKNWFETNKDIAHIGHWERRVLIIGLARLLGEAGKNWVDDQINQKELTPFEQTIYHWSSGKDKKSIEEIL